MCVGGEKAQLWKSSIVMTYEPNHTSKKKMFAIIWKTMLRNTAGWAPSQREDNFLKYLLPVSFICECWCDAV
jgi:hypothetical protein